MNDLDIARPEQKPRQPPEEIMFLSATRIEQNKAAGLGVAGRRMRPASMATFEQGTLSGMRIVAHQKSAQYPPAFVQHRAGARSTAPRSERKNAA